MIDPKVSSDIDQAVQSISEIAAQLLSSLKNKDMSDAEALSITCSYVASFGKDLKA